METSTTANRPALDRRALLRTSGLAAMAATAGLASGAVAGAAPAAAGSLWPAGGAPASGRIDIHHHAVPPAMRQWAVDHDLLPPGGGPRWASWTLAGTLETMDANGIAVGVASAPVPAEVFRDRSVAADGVRVFNETLAELVRHHPDRFGFFANVSLFHPDLAIEQAAYALDVLGADGIIMTTTTGGRYLGDPAFDPVFAELNRRGAVIFTHPGGLPEGTTILPGVDEYIGDFMLDTTRAALNLIASGSMDRYPRLSIVLSHAGGFLPYVAGRVELAGRLGEGPDPVAFRSALRLFYYDTAMPASPYATPTLLAAVDPTHLLYGTDWPAAPAAEVAQTTAALDRDPALDRRTRYGINRGNALRLLPGLARRLATA